MKIGIIAAMEQEMESFQALMQNTEETNIGNWKFITGCYAAHELSLLQCGIGKVNAAVGTALMIDNFSPDVLINTGSAGGVKKYLNIGDVIIPRFAAQHDVDVTAFGYETGQVPGLPRYFESDKRMRDIALKQELPTKSHQIYEAELVTGDSFLHTKEQFNLINTRFPDAACGEMEGGAIAQVCHQFKLPFLIIRSVSDNVHQPENQMEFNDFLPIAAENSLAILKQLLESL